MVIFLTKNTQNFFFIPVRLMTHKLGQILRVNAEGKKQESPFHSVTRDTEMAYGTYFTTSRGYDWSEF